MNVTDFPNYSGIGQHPAASSVHPLVSMLNGRAESPLEAARQALADAKLRLEQHRDEELEAVLDGYLALRARQTSYEDELDVHWKRLESFQTLIGRREELSDQLSAARAEYEAYTASETALDITQHNRLSLYADSLEQELASVTHDISALVEQANRYGSSQRQYADYLEKTGQSGYAAFEYRDTVCSEETFMSETAGMIERLEAGAGRWQDLVSTYCGQYGRTPYEFECYLQERRELGDAYAAAQQRLAELLYTAEHAAPEEGAEHSPQDAGPSGKIRFDRVEIGKTEPEDPAPLPL